MSFEIIDEFGYGKTDYLSDLIKYSLNKLNTDGILSVILIDDDKMKELNSKYRGIDNTTDVLSFALNDDKTIKTNINVLGDIYISIPKMISQAKEYNHSEKRELSFLVVHGLLHLLGYDHQTKEEEKIMFDLQEEILNEKGITK